jgi:putative endonuclease
MYILECADGTFYTGSTKDLKIRRWEHENLKGANYTKKKHPVRLVYFEEYARIDDAFYREKQVQGWSHAKKKSLVEGKRGNLHNLSECKNESHSRNFYVFSSCHPVTSTPLSDRVDIH